MKLQRQLSDALDRARGDDVRCIGGNAYALWTIVDPPLRAPESRERRSVVDRCKREILDAMLAARIPVLLSHPDDPTAERIPGTWRRAGAGAWHLPTDLDLDDPATSHWLFALGNWRMYTAPRALEIAWPDPARLAPAALDAWLQSHGIDILIDSFHDDVSWVVAVAAG